MMDKDIICYAGYKLILKRTDIQDWHKVTDAKDRDVTDKIIVHAGRDKNFYGIKTEIKDIVRTSSLTFHYEGNVTKTFNKFIEF